MDPRAWLDLTFDKTKTELQKKENSLFGIRADERRELFIDQWNQISPFFKQSPTNKEENEIFLKALEQLKEITKWIEKSAAKDFPSAQLYVEALMQRLALQFHADNGRPSATLKDLQTILEKNAGVLAIMEAACEKILKPDPMSQILVMKLLQAGKSEAQQLRAWAILKSLVDNKIGMGKLILATMIIKAYQFNCDADALKKASDENEKAIAENPALAEANGSLHLHALSHPAVLAEIAKYPLAYAQQLLRNLPATLKYEGAITTLSASPAETRAELDLLNKTPQVAGSKAIMIGLGQSSSAAIQEIKAARQTQAAAKNETREDPQAPLQQPLLPAQAPVSDEVLTRDELLRTPYGP